MKARLTSTRPGFTAVELLIATAVGVVLLLIVGMAFSNVTGAVGASSARASVYNKARLVFDMMKKDFDGIYRDRTVGTALAGVDMLGLTGHTTHTLPQEQAPTTESFYHMRIRFTTTTALSGDSTGMACVVEYSLMEEDTVGGTLGNVSATSDLSRLHLVRRVWKVEDLRAWLGSGNPFPDANETEIVATHVGGFDVKWIASFNADGTDGADSGHVTPVGGWASVAGTQKYPLVLRVRIDMADGQNVVQEYNGGYPMTFVQEFGLNTENVTPAAGDGI